MNLRRPAFRLVLPVLLGALLGSVLAASATAADGDRSLPQHGRSLFDRLFERETDGTPQVPFPFPALLQRVRAQLDGEAPNGGMAIVLIPLGRSLQRHAAGDVDAFRFPRVVAAVTGEPVTNAPAGHLYLKDRLYLAHHERAEALEVISYNEDEGRFEFQLVLDYRAGATPRVVAANRTLCLACHQNAAPIFSRPSWDETSASPAVAARLAATGLDYQGLPWRHGVDVPEAIDAATTAANRLTVAQRLWQEGCALATAQASIDCRAQALLQALRQRLVGGAATIASTDVRQRLVEPLLASWQARWPDGLVIPDPQVPNRQPFAGIEGGIAPPTDAELVRYADIPAAFDPLALRPPLELWRGRNAGDVARFVHLLGELFSRADLALIERALARMPRPTARRMDLTCTLRRAAIATRADLDCAAGPEVRLQARIRLDGNRIADGIVDRLALPGSHAHSGVALSLSAGQLEASDSPLRFTLATRRGGPVRASTGEAITTLRLDGGDLSSGMPAWSGAADRVTASLELVDDLQPLGHAVDALAQANVAGEDDALTAAPARRMALLAPLLRGLGEDVPASPSLQVPAPPPPAEIAQSRTLHWPADLQPFLRQCSQCHSENTAFPPGFLHGDESRVRANLATCAQRMRYRLEMNRLPPAARPKTPMPPPAAAHAAALLQSPDLAAMRDLLERLLQARGAPGDDVLAQPYATLEPCRIPTG
jgi:mono/diheme cytochrome c family protein